MKLFTKLTTIIPIVIVSGILLIGCKEKEDSVDSTRVQARILAGIQTRAIDTSWEKNDCIGLHIFKTGTNDFVYNRHNYQYSTPEGSSHFNASSDDIIYYPLDGSSIDFIGYYPYDATMTEACVCRADVSDQTILSAIDLMTSERFTGASQSTPDVTIRFHHRLSKLIFRAFYQDKITELPIEKVVIKGMNTAATYNILTETLTVDAGSGKTLEAVSRDNKKVEAIVLPRKPAEGVTFIITSAGREYTAHLSEEQEFKSGFKYTFNLVLNDEHGSEPTIKAIIQDWVDGGEIDAESKLVTISNGPGEAIGFNPGDVITLYHEDMELTRFTYDGTDWSPETPIYWENIGDGVSEEITLRAMFQRADALNGEQMPEVFLSETTTRRYESIYLHFNLAPAKIVVKLTSNSQDANETFSSEELAAATILLPSYIYGYDITNGIFTPGDSAGDIALADGQALIVPQTKSGPLATITLNGNRYSVVQQEPQQFLAGKVYTITVNILKSQVNPAFHLSYTDWTPGDSISDKEGTPVNLYLSGSTANFVDGDRFTLYTDTEKLTEYTYDGSTWSGDNDIYWEKIGDGFSTEVTFRAEFKRANKLNNTQMDEVFLAEVTCQRFGKVALDFKLVPAKVIVVLISESTTEPDKKFSEDQLKKATVLLDQYQIGGSFANGLFIPGTVLENIKAVNISGNETQKEALVQPQSKTGTLARITLLDNEYKIEHSTGLDLQGGKVYTITVNMLKSTLNPSFDIGYTDWVDGSNNTKNATPVKLTEATGITNNFVLGDKIKLYDVVNNAYLTTYEYEGTNKWKIPAGESALYWEDIGDGFSSQVKIRAEFIRTDKLNNTQLPELFLAENTCNRFGNLSFQFKLVPAKISFVLESKASLSSDTFTGEQLKNATITLPGYETGYTLVNGAFSNTAVTGNVTVADDRTALIIPQTKTGKIATVRLLNVDYDITDVSGIEFKAGENTKITVNVVKTNVTTFSASYTEWADVPGGPYDALKIVTGNVTTNNFESGDKLSLYYTNTAASKKEFIAQFEYKGENQWTNTNSSSTSHYWQNLNNQVEYDFYAVSTLAQAPGSSNQMDDVMYAECKGVDKLGAITLAFTKKTSKINVVLKSESSNGNTFTESELRSATITLPGYEIGAKYDGIVYSNNGAAIGNIKANTTTDTDGSPTWTALIEPQTINAANVAQTVLIRITIGGVDYELKRSMATVFAEANQYTYTINLLKTGITFTTTYSEWTNNDINGGDIGLD